MYATPHHWHGNQRASSALVEMLVFLGGGFKSQTRPQVSECLDEHLISQNLSEVAINPEIIKVIHRIWQSHSDCVICHDRFTSMTVKICHVPMILTVMGTWQILTSNSLSGTLNTSPPLLWKHAAPETIPERSIAMESYFSGLCKELSHSRHHNTGERSPTAKWHVLRKNSTSAYLLHYTPSVLGWEESKQLILIYLWNKVSRKTGFHKAQTISLRTPQTEAYCQIWGRILEEPRELATLEVMVSSDTGQMCPKGRNTGSWSKIA